MIEHIAAAAFTGVNMPANARQRVLTMIDRIIARDERMMGKSGRRGPLVDESDAEGIKLFVRVEYD